MTPDRYRQVKEHFHAVSDLDTDARRHYLDAMADRALRADVEELLANTDSEFLEAPLVGAIEPQRVGPYAILRELGRGGMGVVYLAERDRQLFALKVIKRGFDTDAITARFRRESRILEAFDHPNIAHIIDGGATDDGRPYFAMEYIDGQPLDEYASQVTIDGRLALFEAVCRAVHYAHERGVIHRDLKPANIHVRADGTPKLLDFGIAKVVDDASATKMTTLTGTGQRILTPAYASPEQLLGEAITPSSDVYSLGVILFELLTSRRPFAGTNERKRPVRPSSIVRDLPPGIDDIVVRCIAIDPLERYATAASLADDVARVRRGERIDRHQTSRIVRPSIIAIALLAVFGSALSFLPLRVAAIPPKPRQTYTTYNRADVMVRIRDADSAAIASPQSPEAWANVVHRRTNAYFLGFDRSEENRSHASEAMRHAVALAPDAPAVRLAQAFFDYYQRKDLDAARSDCRWLLRHAPDDPTAHAIMGYISRREGRFDDAMRDLRAALRLAPSNVDYLGQLGFTAIYLRRYDDARHFFESALQVAPAAPEILAMMAETQWMTGKSVDAPLPFVDRIADAASLSSFAGTTKYRHHLLSRKYEEAAHDLESVPVSAYILYDFANAYVPRDLLIANAYALAGNAARAKTRFDSARAQLEAEVAQSPDDPMLHDSLAQVYAGLGRGDDAMREANHATMLAPVARDAVNASACLLHRAKIEAAIGRKAEALNDIAALLEQPAPLTPAILRLDPAWDPIRAESRFQLLSSDALKTYAGNVAAHNAYVQARFELAKRTPDAMKRARDAVERAVTLDPNYGLAWSALGDIYYLSAFYGAGDQRVTLAKALDAGSRAVRLAPDMAETHSTFAAVSQQHYDWALVDREFERAIAINPRYASAHHAYAMSLAGRGRIDAALQQIREAEELDALTPILGIAEGMILVRAGRYDESIVQTSAAIARNPAFYAGYIAIAEAYAAKGDTELALAAIRKGLQLQPRDPFGNSFLAWLQGSKGLIGEARRLAEAAEAGFAEHRYQPTLVAVAWVGARDYDRAMKWMERAVDDRDPLVVFYLNVSYELKPLRKDPRFAALLKKANL
jgi:serine/threonine protein kinase/Tfp pilus assembly protein PilF